MQQASRAILSRRPLFVWTSGSAGGRRGHGRSRHQRSSPSTSLPRAGCLASQDAHHAGRESFAGLCAHVDAHLLGVLPGRPPPDWLRTHNLVSCRICSKLVSRRCHGGFHRTCAASAFAARPPPQLPEASSDADVTAVLSSLPSLDEICSADVATQETLGDGLLPLAEREFLRCVAAIP